MTDDLVKNVCQEWVDEGLGDECFWENWPGGPTDEALSPRMVLDRIEALERDLKTVLDREAETHARHDEKIEAAEAKLAKAVAALREATHQHRVIAGFDLMCASVTAYNAARAAEAVLRELGAEPFPPEFRADDAIFLAKYAQHVAEELGIAQSTEEPTP